MAGMLCKIHNSGSAWIYLQNMFLTTQPTNKATTTLGAAASYK